LHRNGLRASVVNLNMDMGERIPVIEPRSVAHFDRVEASRGRTVDRAHHWPYWLAGACLAGLCLYLWATSSSGKPAPRAPLIPVMAATARIGDLETYLSQIGTVTPFATDTLKSRVAGQIIKIDFREGDAVKAGQVLINIDSKPYEAQLQQYEGQLNRDRALLANAKITFDRYRDLYRQGVIARQDLDNQQTLYNQAIGTVDNDQGLIAGVKVNLGYCEITAPITGRIGLRLVDLGNYVQATDSLVVITKLQPISVIFSINEDYIPQIAADMKAQGQLPVEAWNRDMSKQIATGFLLTFDNQIDQTTGTVKLRAEFANNDYALFPNQFVNARVLVSTLHQVLLIPTMALQKTPQGTSVYLVQQNQTVAQRDVKVTATQGETTAIASGLSPGDVVVTDGLDKLQPGTHVKVQEAGAPVQNARE
jgi:multidrug efflux system membrane fusion protein